MGSPWNSGDEVSSMGRVPADQSAAAVTAPSEID